MRALVKRAVVMLSLSASWSKGALAATPSSSDGVIGSNAPSNTASRSSGASSSSGEVQSTIDAASVNRPAPGKSKGEDAVNVHADCHFAYAALGDGVGGWTQVDVDPSAYSQALVANSLREFATMVSQAVEGSDVTLPSGGITSILQNAHASTTGILGSSTLTLVCLIGNMLHIANLGDSGVVVCSPKYENGIKWSTSSGQHSFNFPKQLAHQPTVDAFAEREKERARACGQQLSEDDDATGPSHDSPENAESETIALEAGDRVVLASDGVWDNIFLKEVSAIALSDSSASASHIADGIADAAEQAAMSQRESPFTRGAKLSGWAFENFGLQGMFVSGGKPDDTSVAVIRYDNDTP